MPKYTWEDVIDSWSTSTYESVDLIGKEGYFTDIINNLDDITTFTKNELKYVSSEYFLDSHNCGWRYFIPEKEPSYKEAQDEWVEDNKIEVGDFVQICKRFTYGEEGYNRDYSASSYDGFIGLEGEILGIDENGISIFISEQNSYVVWPYFGLKKITALNYESFDFTKEEDRDFLRGKWVKCIEPGVFYEFQINRFVKEFCGIVVKDDINYTSEDLFYNFTFLDGSVIGRKKNE